MTQLFTGTTRLFQGRSFWKVRLATGKTFTEGQVSFDFLRGTRNVVWKEDITGSGDNRNIREITLCTPEGDYSLDITTPYSAFQMQMGTLGLFGGGRQANAQIVGRVDNFETGACVAHIWDVQGEEQADGTRRHLFLNHMTTVTKFTSWRCGIPDPGMLNLDAIGLRGIQL